jgi:hypothetical protein
MAQNREKKKMTPKTLTYVKLFTTVSNNTAMFVTVQSNLKEQFFNSNLWNEVKFDKCLHSTKKLSDINQLKQFSDLRNIQTIPNINFSTTFLTLCHTRRQIYQLVWDADP